MLELKLKVHEGILKSTTAFNRTMLELKLHYNNVTI